MSTKSRPVSGHINRNGAPAGASVEELRAARLALAAKIGEGAEYLRPIFNEVEDALIERIARGRRRGREDVAA